MSERPMRRFYENMGELGKTIESEPPQSDAHRSPLLSLLDANIPPEARGILRELAVAEHRKVRYERLLAELDVVIPYLRRRAEKLTPPIEKIKFKWTDIAIDDSLR